MKKILIILIILSLTLSGCVSMTEVDEDKVEDLTDKITKTIIDSVGKEDAKRQESHQVEATNLTKLDIESSVGNIFITTHDSSEVTVDLNITAKSKSKEKAQQLVDNFNYSINEKWDTLKIVTTQEDSNILDNDNIQTELSVNIPKNIKSFVISLNVGDIDIKNTDGNFEINNNVGNIEIYSSAGSFNLKSDVGEVILDNCTPLNKTELKANTGDIKVIFTDITEAKTITAETGVGDIELATPDNSNYEAEIDEFMKDKIVVNKGSMDTKIKLKTGVGDINFK